MNTPARLHFVPGLLFPCLLALGCAADDTDAAMDAGSSGEAVSTSGIPDTETAGPASDTTTTQAGSDDTAADDASSTTGGADPAGLDPDDFDPAGLSGDITIVDCTLSNGEEASCYSIPILGAPSDHDVGPFCPRNISDGADLTGIWIESGEVYDVDGTFITELAEFYNDDTWQLFDPESGDVFVTDTLAACEAAAQPNVPAEYNNYCVECSLDYFGGGVPQEGLIPVTPVLRDAPAEIDGMTGVGIALNGVDMDPPAPVDAILGAYTIAAFDDCGGHVNPVAGYHYHAATGCPREIGQDDGHAPKIGYALDGHGIHAMVGDDGVEPADLDACRGHADASRGYHYHVASPGENMFIGCFAGEIVGDTGGPGGDGGGPGVMSCDDVPDGMPCCGDASCDNPIETADNCAEDCG